MAQEEENRTDIPKAYESKQVEDRLYRFWLEKEYFRPEIDWEKEPFVIIMPPPNVTGELHLGHALTTTIEDMMVRWHRMKGDPTLWLPGIDHAGIAGQIVVEQLLAKEGLTRHDLGREKFQERVWEWMNKYRHIIAEQHMRLGASCDWSRERFTMDPGPSRAVRTTFVRLYEKGLIYRGERIINWCPRCATALSDLEVEHEDTLGSLYYILYPLATREGWKQEYIEVATTRPETMLGDTAVAVNPKDNRYKHLVGRMAILPILNRPIPIIEDEAVDPTFGTGAVKVTPAHDPVDFEIGQRHGLPSITVINLDASMNENAGPYSGLDRYACREALIEDLKKQGLLVKTDPHVISIARCERCGTVVEPLVSLQWFVKIKPLAEPAIRAVVDGEIKIIPERFIKVYLNWMENIRDWCISRQLWWGHRIPVWYCSDCSEVTVSVENPSACVHCGSSNVTQDPDVLDTWFSSGLWPHSTLGWPENTEDFRYFYPTTVMETGYDILFFWVARMIMLGLENTGEVPFKYVFLHGLVRDDKGDKMSKSKGNVVSPLETIDTYGTDALRFTLATGSTPGNDIKLSSQRLEASRNFANKLWNASRFILTNIPPGTRHMEAPNVDTDSPLADRWIMSRLSRLVSSVNELLESFQLGEAQRQIHDFVWGEFCDWYIEMAKLRLGRATDVETETRAGEPSPLPVLVHVLDISLRLLHPAMPFITEEIWQKLVSILPALSQGRDSIMIAPYPTADETCLDIKAEWQMDLVMDVVRAIRNIRAQYGVEASKWVEVIIVSDEAKGLIESQARYINRLARARPIRIESRLAEKPEQAASALVDHTEIYLPLASIIDLDAERKRLQKEIDASLFEMERLEAKLANNDFLSKAPENIVGRERDKLQGLQDRTKKLRSQLADVGNIPGS